MRRRLLVTVTCVLCAAEGAAQGFVAPTLSPEDSARSALLAAEGVTVTRRHVELIVPADFYPAAHLEALADSIDRGIAALERLVGERTWRRWRPGEAVRIHVAPGRFIAHGTGLGSVFVSAMHARHGFAPWLHESAHELTVPRPPYFPSEFAEAAERRRAYAEFPLWLFEGVAEYLARTAARQENLVEGDILGIGGLDGAALTCAGALAEHPELAGHIGARGFPPQLFGPDRMTVATGFYACSLSHTSFLVDRLGLDAVLEAFADRDPVARIEAAAEASADRLRAEWIGALRPESAADSDVSGKSTRPR